MASLLCFCVPRMGYEGLRGSAFLRPGVRGAHLSWLSQRPLLLSREIDDLGHLFLYASHFSIPRRPCIILGCPKIPEVFFTEGVWGVPPSTLAEHKHVLTLQSYINSIWHISAEGLSAYITFGNFIIINIQGHCFFMILMKIRIVPILVNHSLTSPKDTKDPYSLGKVYHAFAN